MEEKNEIDWKNDDVMLPGFRFHPTDEELVGFYLMRKIQKRPLPIELIKQVDIYKYDPWDLPKELATSGEKEWYFYCPRDRKYRNSARPNRVTKAGFWKATGTDRPIYSSDGAKCIGLKKSLVFYRGRASKGIKTDWMMHEFRLPSLGDISPPKKLLDKSLPPNDAWAICRIFKKNNSMAQRALSCSWVSPPIGEASPPDIIFPHQFISEQISCTTEIGSVYQLNSINDHLQQGASNASFSASDLPPSYRPINLSIPNARGDLPRNFMFSTVEISTPNKSITTIDTTPSMLNPAMIGDVNKTCESNIDSEVSQLHFNAFPISLTQDGTQNILGSIPENNQWGIVRSLGFPFSLPSEIPDAWDSTCNEISTANKCYT